MRNTPKIASPTIAALRTMGVSGWLVATAAKITVTIATVPQVDDVTAAGAAFDADSRSGGISFRTIRGAAGRFERELSTIPSATR